MNSRRNGDGEPDGVDPQRAKRKRKKAAGPTDDASKVRKTPEARARRRRERKTSQLDAAAVAGRGSPDANAEVTLPHGGFAQPRVLMFLAAALAAGFVYERNLLGDDKRPYALIALALLSFLLGSSPGTNPRITVGAGGAIVCVGLAIVGTRPSDLGVVLCILGGLLLTGGIHRLGRMGPAGATPPQPGQVQPG